MKKTFITIVLLLITVNLYSQDKDWKIGGQIQLRTELDGRDFSNATYPPIFTSLRSRLFVEKYITDKFNFYVEVEDSRVFGEEATTTANSKNIDLHQGYVWFKNFVEAPISVQAGRFEMSYGTERFIGALGWNYVGRSFDGARVRFGKENKTDLFAITTKNSVPYIASGNPANYPYPSGKDSSSSLYGLWSNIKSGEKSTFDVFGYYEINRKKSNGTDNDISRMTLGMNYRGNYDMLSTVFEGAYQFGKLSTLDVSAYLLSLQLNYGNKNVKVGVGADILSGNDAMNFSNNNTFATPFATNHKFYGYMDYFLNIPGDTKNLGLNDMYASINYAADKIPLTASLMAHNFMSNKKNIDSENGFGQEFDLTLKYQFIKEVMVTWGGSIFLPGDLMKRNFNTANGSRDDAAFWSYIMITTNL
ncbi:MAG: alginate export family protein [Bacteroidetes bacterium]|nr:alginate export family protein [Bacteroidota bacterium]